MNWSDERVSPTKGFQTVTPWMPDQTEPSTDYEALMRAEPHSEPEQSLQSRLAVKDLIGAAFAALSPEETWIVNSIYSEQLSLRATARQIGAPKTTVARIRDRALKKLRKELSASEEARDYLARIGIGIDILSELGEAQPTSDVTEVPRTSGRRGGDARQEASGLRQARQPVRQRQRRRARGGAGAVDRSVDPHGGQDAAAASSRTRSEPCE